MSMKVLHQHGWSIAAMAREIDLNWRTVKRALKRADPPACAPRQRLFALNDAQLVHVERRLAVCPGIRGTDLHAELRHDYGYEGSYPTFQRQLRLLRPAVVRDPEIRFETAPGVQTQADWAEMGLWPLGKEMVELSVMVAIGVTRRSAVTLGEAVIATENRTISGPTTNIYSSASAECARIISSSVARSRT